MVVGYEMLNCEGLIFFLSVSITTCGALNQQSSEYKTKLL